MTILYFDCFSGASGDMILGALLDAGLPLDDLRRALGSLAIDRDAVWTERVMRAGVVATKFYVRGEEPSSRSCMTHAPRERPWSRRIGIETVHADRLTLLTRGRRIITPPHARGDRRG